MFLKKFSSYSPFTPQEPTEDLSNVNQMLQAKLESSQVELQILERKYEDEKMTQLKL